MKSIIVACVVAVALANTLHYSSDEFNRVNDFMDVYHWSHNNATIQALGDVIKEHNMEKYVILQLLHTHFKLNPHEILVEKMEADETWTHPYNVSLINMTNVNPYLLKYTSDGIIVPLEFVASSRFMPYEKMNKRVNRVINAVNFTQAFVAALKKLNVEGIFGIGIPHRDYLSRKYDGHTMENSNSQERWYHVKGIAEKKKTSLRGNNNELWCGHNCEHACGNHEMLWCGHNCDHACGNHAQNKPEILWCGHNCDHACGNHAQNKVDSLWCGHSCDHACGNHAELKTQEKSLCTHSCTNHWCWLHSGNNMSTPCVHPYCNGCPKRASNITAPKEEIPSEINVQVGWTFRN